MILINIIFLTDDEKHGDDISFYWPAAPGIGEAINLYTGPYQGKYRVIGALWEPTIDWTGNVQNMSPNGCSVTLAVRRIGDPQPTPTEDMAKSFIEMSELASRLRQQLINTKTDLTIAREERDEMRKQHNTILDRARYAEAKLQDASLQIAELEKIIEELKELK